MTNQEKDLIEIIEQMDCKYGDYGEAIYDSKSLSQAIITKYPQILADKVWEGEFTTGAFLGIPPISVPRGKYQVFIREVK